MNRIFHSNETVLFRLSRNAEFYPGDTGRFELVYRRHHKKVFATLLEAFLFYFTVNDEAELWDRTGKLQLIEEKIKLCLN